MASCNWRNLLLEVWNLVQLYHLWNEWIVYLTKESKYGGNLNILLITVTIWLPVNNEISKNVSIDFAKYDFFREIWQIS